MTYSEIRKNEEVLTFIKKGNANLGAMGFTDHSEAHSGLVAERGAEILKKFGYPEKDIELVKIVISLNLQIDPKICSMYEYFEIFLGRMMMCKRAAEVLEASFKLTVNGAKVL